MNPFRVLTWEGKSSPRWGSGGDGPCRGLAVSSGLPHSDTADNIAETVPEL